MRAATKLDTDETAAGTEEHQVLYRKFRPRQFADVVGQDHVIQPLKRRLAEGQLPHALLFTGPRGCGKTTSARLLAASANCPNTAPDGEPCGECATCRGIITGSGTIGVMEVDAASNRGINEMKDLIASMSVGSVAEKKVYVIDECHMLTREASNALLKTLEEPPADTLIVLCTTEPNKILDTIKSRTVTFNFKAVPAEVMTPLVREVVEKTGIDIDEAGIAEVVRRGHGSPRDTLTALEGYGGPDATDDVRSRLPVIAKAVADKDASALVIAIAEAIGAGVDVPELTRSLQEHWRNCLLALEAPKALAGLPEQDVKSLAAQAKALKPNRVVRLLNLTAEALGKMTATGDARVLLETTLLQVALPSASDSLDGVYDLLEDALDEIEDLKRLIKGMPTAAAPAPAAAQTDWPPAPADPAAAKEAPEPEPEPEGRADAPGEPQDEEPADASGDNREQAAADDEDGGSTDERAANGSVEDFGDIDEAEGDASGYEDFDDSGDESRTDEDDERSPVSLRDAEPDPEHTHDEDDASGFLDCPHPLCKAKAKKLDESEKEHAEARDEGAPRARKSGGAESKKKFFEEDDAPTARDLVEAIQFHLIDRKYARYLQDSVMDAFLEDDILVFELRKDSPSVPPKAAIDALLDCASHLWVEDIEYDGDDRP